MPWFANWMPIVYVYKSKAWCYLYKSNAMICRINANCFEPSIMYECCTKQEDKTVSMLTSHIIFVMGGLNALCVFTRYNPPGPVKNILEKDLNSPTFHTTAQIRVDIRVTVIPSLVIRLINFAPLPRHLFRHVQIFALWSVYRLKEL